MQNSINQRNNKKGSLLIKPFKQGKNKNSKATTLDYAMKEQEEEI